MDPRAASSPFFAPLPSTPRTKKHLLLACTGSIAAIKLPDILTALSRYTARLSIHIILTPSTLHFLPYTLTHPSPGVAIPTLYPIVSRAWTNADEWVQWTKIGDPVLHIELRKWADILVIAPLSADFLAKMVGGFVDGLLGGVTRAWDVEKSIVVAPAMNTLMWQHPVTREQMDVLRNKWEWVQVLEPVEKSLACGDVGTGAMIEWWEVVEYVLKELGLEGKEGEEEEEEEEENGKGEESGGVFRGVMAVV
ncbi:flavoprotein [Tirmania nivea]|nr:flavoprotein [Tirmania nivea]